MIYENPLIQVAKKAAGEAAANLIEDGMLVGLGTGSTAAFFIEALAQRCREGLNIKALASSQQSQRQAQAKGITLLDNQEVTSLDITVDGADEIDHSHSMIKGGGGALLREKILAYSSREMVVIVDDSKLVTHLGGFPVPVEIAPFAYRTTIERIAGKGYKGGLRLNRDETIFITDNGNYIFDIHFNKPIMAPEHEHEILTHIVGVLETGFFFRIARRMVVGFSDGFAEIRQVK